MTGVDLKRRPAALTGRPRYCGEMGRASLTGLTETSSRYITLPGGGVIVVANGQ